MPSSDIETTERIVRVIADTVLANEAYFCELDGVVGDGDFGYSLARGFEKILEDWDNIDRSSPGNFLKRVGMIIPSRVGGVSGTIWGTAFMRAGMSTGAKTDLTEDDIIAMFRAAIEGIKKRGESDLGDKTLLDSLVPAVDELERAFKAGEAPGVAIQSAAVVARQAAEATRPMLAKRGRAAYTGERSIGTLDAGAVAIAVLFEAIAANWQTVAVG